MSPPLQFILKQFFPYAVTIVLGLQINDLALLLTQNSVLWLLIIAPIWVAYCATERVLYFGRPVGLITGLGDLECSLFFSSERFSNAKM